MKKLLVSTIALSLTFSPLAKAENIKNEVPTTLGQNIDALINHSEKEIAAGLAESKDAANKLANIPPRESELATLRLQLEAYKSARIVNSEDGRVRLAVSVVTSTGIVGSSLYIASKFANKSGAAFKAARYIPGVGKAIITVATVLGGIAVATATSSILILSAEDLKIQMDYTKARIAELESLR